MSGIAGFVALDRSPVASEHVQAAASALAVAGPDDLGWWAGGPAALVHSLLRTHPEAAAPTQRLRLFDFVQAKQTAVKVTSLLFGFITRGNSNLRVMQTHHTGSAWIQDLHRQAVGVIFGYRWDACQRAHSGGHGGGQRIDHIIATEYTAGITLQRTGDQIACAGQIAFQ